MKIDEFMAMHRENLAHSKVNPVIKFLEQNKKQLIYAGCFAVAAITVGSIFKGLDQFLFHKDTFDSGCKDIYSGMTEYIYRNWAQNSLVPREMIPHQYLPY